MAGGPHLSDEGASGQVPTEPAESVKVESQADSDAALPFDDDDDSAVAGGSDTASMRRGSSRISANYCCRSLSRLRST
jgi:hypothetical protein